MDIQKQFAILLHETARTWRQEIDRRLKDYGLSQSKWRTLLCLDLSHDTLTQSELAHRLGIEDPTLVRTLDRLAKDGWVERKNDPGDRRSKTVHLTTKAHQTLRYIHAAADQVRHALLGNISEKQLQSCIDLFENIKHKAGTAT